METAEVRLGELPRLRIQLETPALTVRLGHPLMLGGPLAELTVMSGDEDVVYEPPEGYYGFGRVTVLGDADLVPENIRRGVEMFGVIGTCGDSAALGAFGLVFKPWQGRLGPFFLTLTETLADTAALTGCGTVLHTLKHLGTYRIDAPGEELDGGAALTAAGFIKEE